MIFEDNLNNEKEYLYLRKRFEEDKTLKTRCFLERRKFKESNILFKSDKREAIDSAISRVSIHRMELETYIALHPEFCYSLSPIKIETGAPKIIKIMVESTNQFGVGPMAAVAGVLSDLAVEAMQKSDATIAIVEDGGEISALSKELFTVGVYAGANVLSNKFGFQIYPSDCPIGVATSSATVGHALSFGNAEAVTVIANSAGIADAAATSICNSVYGDKVEDSIRRGLELAGKFSKIIRGAIIVRGKYIGSVGKLPQLVQINNGLDMSKALNDI